MQGAVDSLLEVLPIEALKSFTSDRGKEFACYPEIENHGIDFYFADAYSDWQRGRMRTRMVCEESSSQRKQIYQKSLQNNSMKPCG